MDVTLAPTFAEAPDVLKPSEAQALLRIGRNQIYAALARGDIFAVRVGASYRIPKEALRRFLTNENEDDRQQGAAP